MPREKTSIYKEPDLNAEIKRENFRDFLAEYYGRRWGSIKKFAEERHLNLKKVYRQLNGTDELSKALVDEMAAFERDKKLG